MRLVQIFVPDDDRAAVEDTLDGMNVEYLFVDEDGSREGAIAYIPLPTGAVDTILDRLHGAGLDEDTYTVVTDAERATVPNVDALTDRYVEGPAGPRGASHPEIRERARDLKPDTATYVAFAALSAVVAVGGLLLDSSIVIVGAMVIAPFAGSALSASVGAVIDDREMVVDSATSQALGLVVAFVGAILMGVVLQRSGFVPEMLVVSRIEQVSAFLTPNLLTLAIAVAAGAAGALALATDLPVSIAGVAVAAAIIPATATAGIGVVWGQPLVLLGAVVLLFMNIVFINLAAYVALVALGYRSSLVRSTRENLSVSLRTGAYTVVVLLFVVVVALTAVGTYQHLAFEREVNQEVETVVQEPAYRSLELVAVETEYNDMNLLGSEETVTVTVSRSSDREYDDLDAVLQSRISEATGQPVAVNVRILEFRRARPDAEPSQPPTVLARVAERLRSYRDALDRLLDAALDAATGVIARPPEAAVGCPRPC